MNYRHAFHAGNFADVLKHVVLTRILIHLRKKEAPFRVIDTHAGAAQYDLRGPEAERNPEWRDGIGRVIDADLGKAGPLIAPYLDVVRAANPNGTLSHYPGSPALVASFMREQDRLIACELEPKAATALARYTKKDARLKAIAIDGWTALTAYIPPKERRGLVLIDPPFEQADEFERLGAALLAAHRKWPNGTYLAWYPIKDARDVTTLIQRIVATEMNEALRIELVLADAGAEGLRGSGLIALNAPWTLEAELKILLPALASVLGRARPARTLLQHLACGGR
jgi:23S rRNA (adenine2030-N6)-methyltransferase